MTYHFDLNYVMRILDPCLEGLLVTIELSLAAIVASLLCGIALCILMLVKSSTVRVLCRAYVETFRNTPLLLHMFLLFYGLPLLSINISGFWCGVIAITLQYSGYIAETLRGGVAAVSQTQIHAARALGFGRFHAYSMVVIPQAVIKSLPPLGNILIDIVKWSSLGASIGIMELTLTARVLAERSAAVFEVFFLVGVLYLVLTSALTMGLRRLERRWANI